jgi:hypothetical protein
VVTLVDQAMAAVALGCSERQVRRLTAEGRLPNRGTTGRPRYAIADLQRLPVRGGDRIRARLMAKLAE